MGYVSYVGRVFGRAVGSQLVDLVVFELVWSIVGIDTA